MATRRKKLDNTEIETIRIFLSFRLEDQPIADGLANVLSAASGRKIEFARFPGIRGGERWRDWIEEEIQRCHALIFIYTDVNHSWDFCIFEVANFMGTHRGDGRPVIPIKAPGIDQMPSPVEDIQWTTGDYAGLKKLVLNIASSQTYFTNPLNDNLRKQESWGQIKRGVFELSTRFAPLIRTKFLAPRLGISLSEAKKASDTPDEAGFTQGLTIQQYEIEDAPLEGSQALELLHLAEGSRFRNLQASFADGRFNAWLNDLRGIIERLRADPNYEQPLKALSPFKSSQGQTYVPIISRYQRFLGRPDVQGMESDFLRKVYLSLIPAELEGHPVRV